MISVFCVIQVSYDFCILRDTGITGFLVDARAVVSYRKSWLDDYTSEASKIIWTETEITVRLPFTILSSKWTVRKHTQGLKLSWSRSFRNEKSAVLRWQLFSCFWYRLINFKGKFCQHQVVSPGRGRATQYSVHTYHDNTIFWHNYLFLRGFREALVIQEKTYPAELTARCQVSLITVLWKLHVLINLK